MADVSLSRSQALRERLCELAEAPAGESDLAEAALIIASEHDPDVEIALWLGRMEQWARAAAPSFARADGPAAVARALIATVHETLGFAGNTRDYYDPRNSYFHSVLERRTGIPITLALVYLALGRRLGLDVRGVGFPGHFLVTVGPEPRVIVDPFSGQVLTREQCQERLTAALGPGARLGPQHLAEATPAEFLVRMLRNLKQIFLGPAMHDDTPEAERGPAGRNALACCDRILLLQPDDAAELRDRGFVHGRMGHAPEAYADLERALELAPDAEWAEAVRRRLPALRTLAGPLN
jgi:regulator of sirC expression with transglutaminase-like and TPR domain